jgi:phosphoribosylanthranilate isomerase
LIVSASSDRPELPAIKFCGLTIPGDAGYAAELGAAYVGVIFADSARKVSEDTARAVFDAAGSSTKHVAVFGSEDPIDSIVERARRIGAQVLQLHRELEPAEIEGLRANFSGEIWAVVSVDPDADRLPRHAFDLADSADAILLDARIGNRSGGSGRPLAWSTLASDSTALSALRPIILAGGLKAENVGEAIRAMRPSVVDVSSGVEASPGVKDRPRMKAFAEAVRSASIVGWNTTPGPDSK